MRAYNLRSALQKPEFVTELFLHGMDLKEVPAEVFRLSNLRKLDLSGNQLPRLPETIDQLRQLEVLHLTDNLLTHLPWTLQRLPALRELLLSNNQFQTWPEPVNALPNLEMLDLGINELAEIPATIENLPRLKRLFLRKNQLKKLPKEIGRCTGLLQLELSDNRLGRLPSALGGCRELDYLDLSSNRIRALPDTLSSLQKLRILLLDKNQMQELPAWLSHCLGLRRLTANRNRLQSLPPELFQAPWLHHLSLQNNRLKSVPDTIDQAGRLESLDLSRNRLAVLPSLFSLTGLKNLNLQGNQLRNLPTLPANLVFLNAGENLLTQCSPELFSLTRLEELILAGNKLAELDPRLSQLAHLKKLDLRKTGISEIPAVLWALDQLESLQGPWPAATRKRFLQILQASRQAEVPAALRPVFYSLAAGESKALAALSEKELFLAACFPLAKVRNMARSELFGRFGVPTVNLPLGSKIVLAGKTNHPHRHLTRRLAGKGVQMVDRFEAGISYLLLGERPDWNPELTGRKIKLLAEPQLIGWLNAHEDRYLYQEADAGQLARLRQLLLHQDPTNVTLAISLLEGGGVPPALLTDLWIAWKTTPGKKQKRALQQLLRQNTPEAAHPLLQQPISLSRKQPEALLRANIQRLCEGTPFEEERIWAYLAERE